MRLALALALVAACRIPDETFTPIGGGDGGTGGDGGGTGDASIDSAMALAKRHGWALDRSTGLHHALKDAAGDLSGAGTAPVSAGASPELALVNHAGSRIYVFSASASTIHAFPVVDGVLGSPMSLTSPCPVAHAALHPSGNHIALGCLGSDIWVADVEIDGFTNYRRAGANTIGPNYVAFDPGGTCLLVADGGGPSATRVHGFVFDTVGMPPPTNSVAANSSPRAIAAHPTLRMFYVGGSAVQTYTVTATCMVSSFGAVLGGDGTATRAVIDPLVTRMYLAAGGVFAYDIDAAGRLTTAMGSPFIGMQIESATFDPAVPDIIYLTTRSTVFPAAIVAGSLVGRPAVTFTGAGNLQDFVLTP